MLDAELSSLSSSLDDIRKRVVGLAEATEQNGQGDAAHELYEVERALNQALRRMTKMLGR